MPLLIVQPNSDDEGLKEHGNSGGGKNGMGKMGCELSRRLI